MLESLFTNSLNIFEMEKNEINDCEFKSDSLKTEMSSFSILSTLLDKRQEDQSCIKSKNYRSQNPKLKIPVKNTVMRKTNSNHFTDSPKNSNTIKDYQHINLVLNSAQEEDFHSVSEISFDSHKTDCEETKFVKSRIIITPLDHDSICEILFEYFIDIRLSKLEKDEILQIIIKREFLAYLNRDKEKGPNPIKFHYMRKRVCYKLYKVLEKLVRLYLIFF